MSYWRFNKSATPAAPPANAGELHYNSTLNPVGLAFTDEAGVTQRVTRPVVKLTSDGGARTTATLTDEAGLVFPVLSGSYYRIWFEILFTTTAATSGLKFGVTTPTFTIFSGIAHSPLTNTDGTTLYAEALLTSSGDSFAVAATALPTATVVMAHIELAILPSANGNVQLQTANQAGAGTVQIKQASNGVLDLLY